MADRIDEIISQEAFEQINRLFEQLGKCTDRMAEMVMQTKEMADVLGKATSIRETAKAIENLDNATSQLTQTQSERLNIEREIKAEGQKMKQVLDDEVKMWGRVEAAIEKSSIDTYEMVQSQLNLKTRLKEVNEQIKAIEKQHADYRKGIAGVTEVTEKQRERLVDLVEKQGLYKQQIRELNIALKNEAKNMNAASGSYDEMNAQLGRLRDTYRQLSAEERESEDIGGVLLQAIGQLDEKLKAIDKTMGNNQRNVGNYEIAGKSLRLQMRELTMELQNLTLKSRSLDGEIKEQAKLTNELARAKGFESAEYQEANAKLQQMKATYSGITSQMTTLTEQAGDVRDAIADSSRAIGGMAQDAAGLKVATTIAGDMVGAYNAVQMGLVALGADQKDLMQVYAKMQIIQQGLNSLNQIANDLQAEGIIRVRARAMLEKISTTWKSAFVKKEMEQVAATTAETVATKAETSAQRENNAVTATGTVANSAMTASETAQTGATLGLAGAFNALGLAIKSIPVVGWILAGASALAAVTAVLLRNINLHKQENAINERKAKIIHGYRDAMKEANKEVNDDLITLKLNVKYLKSLKEGSRDWDVALQGVAKQLGISKETLKSNIKDVDKYVKKWVEAQVTMAQAQKSITGMVETQEQLDKFKWYQEKIVTYMKHGQKSAAVDYVEYMRRIGAITEAEESKIKGQIRSVFSTSQGLRDAAIKGVSDDFEKNYVKPLERTFAKYEATAMKGQKLLLKDNDTTGATGVGKVVTAKDDNGTDLTSLRDRLRKQGDAVLQEELNLRERLVRESGITGDELAKQLVNINDERYSIMVNALEDEKDLRLASLKKGSEEYILTEQYYNGELDKLQNENADKNLEIIKGVNDEIIKAEEEKNNILYEEGKKANEQKAQQVKEQEEMNKRLKESYYGLASAISDAFFTISDAMADGIKDEQKRLKVQQSLALAEIAIEGGIASMKAISAAMEDATKLGWIVAAAEMVAATAAVSAQIIKITQTVKAANVGSVAAYAEGTSYHTGGDAIVGEAGYPEMVSANGRQFVVDEPTLIKNLPVGSKVVPLTERTVGTFGGQNMQETNEYLRQLVGKQSVSINIGRDVTYYLASGQNRIKVLNKRFSH